ncbi:MAG: DUF2961 domain-containing protein, partial [Planctomycetes bacterium]|nr:DUF2961 domain-containing protein [Planctomycetota bacterium]
MRSVARALFPLALSANLLGQNPPSPAAPEVTFATLLRDLADLDRLIRLPDPDYRTVQYGSSDRRTVSPDRPGWFANADGFGQEPVPGFERVLQPPGADGVGEYLVCDVDGPGAIVRGWSAGMDGVLRVWLDGGPTPLFLGKGYDFFARRTAHLLPPFDPADPGLDPRIAAALQPQQDADYLPIPFQKGLRITWTGRVRDLHFYQLQVRRYGAGARVATFPGRQAIDLRRDAAPRPGEDGALEELAFDLPPGGTWHHERDGGPALLRQLEVTVAAGDLRAALRAVLLRVACDGASVPQVETPLGDFFASAPGITPFRSLPLEVRADGTMVSRWRMPYRASWRIELQNHGGLAVRGTLRHAHGPLPGGFDESTLYCHARWRVDHELHARAGQGPIDLPWLFAIGQGRCVGLACQIVNPPMAPGWRSNWWGEGDERFAVDGVLSTLGTGSEDYFDYSWSHWRYFAHPFCGQPIASGPGNCGYAGNHRFQIVDDLPFAQSLALTMELWTHKPVAKLSYGRTAWFYARPGVLTDHRALQPGELHVPALPPWGEGELGEHGDAATWRPGTRAGGYRTSGGEVEPDQPNTWTRSGAILSWRAPAGGRIEFPFAVGKAGSYRLRVLCQQRPGAPSVFAALDGTVRRAADQPDDEGRFRLDCGHGERFEDLVLEGVELGQGEHVLAVVCPEGGVVGVDLVGYELLPQKPAKLPGALEAELWDLVDKSLGVEVELQNLGAGWSSGHQRFVKCTRVGDAVTFRLPAT